MPKISQLPVATQVNTADLFAIVQAGTTKQANGSLVAAMVSTGLTIPISSVTGLSAALAACLQKVNNLSDVASASASLTNLGLSPLTNGQIWIGSTGLNPVPANLTAGTNVSISSGAGSITISATGLAGIGWVHVTGTTQAMTADTGYLADNAGLVTFTLPATAAFGTVLYVAGFGAGGWQVNCGGGQAIHIGSSSATTSVASTNRYDSMLLLCAVANTTWVALSGVQGNLTIV